MRPTRRRPDPAPRWQDELVEQARRVVPAPMWTYLHSGAREQVTTGEARGSWGDVRFWPRVLRDVSGVSTALDLLGSSLRTPVGVAPTSMQRVVHPDGELAMVRGAVAAGALPVITSNAGHLLSDIGAAAGGSPWWLQAYLPPDRGDAAPVLAAAVDAGARAVVLTVDTPYPGTKHAPAEHEWDGIDLSWHRTNFADPGATRQARDLGPRDLEWLRATTGLPVVAKGVLRAEDARRCVAAGAAAVWVSNHGGRQLDRAVSTREALPRVVAAVDGAVPVLVDGGLWSGLDVLAALALGATACFVGRPSLLALATGGDDGVARLLTTLTDELVEALELAGCTTPQDAVGLVDRPEFGLGGQVV